MNITLTRESDVIFSIYSSDGRLIDKGEISTRMKGLVNYPLKIGNLASGAYFVLLKFQGGFHTLSFVIIR